MVAKAKQQRDKDKLASEILERSINHTDIDRNAAYVKFQESESAYIIARSILRTNQTIYQAHLLNHLKYFGETAVRNALTERCDLNDKEIDMLIRNHDDTIHSKTVTLLGRKIPSTRKIEYRAFVDGKLITEEDIETRFQKDVTGHVVEIPEWIKNK
jgi:hypothetical protein